MFNSKRGLNVQVDVAECGVLLETARKQSKSVCMLTTEQTCVSAPMLGDETKQTTVRTHLEARQ